MDKFDQKIIAELKHNARQSVSAIAKHVGLSRSAVTERIRKLESSGIIKGYRVLVAESQKQEISAYLEIKHQCARCSEVIDLLTVIPEVLTCHGISGDMDLIVFIKTESMQRLHQIREYLDVQSELVKIKTHIVMCEWIDNLSH